MPSEEELGQALRDSLHRLVENIEPSQQLTDAVNEIGTRPGRKRAPLLRQRRVLALASVLLAAIIATGVIGLVGRGTTPSYAVTLEPDHSVQVTLYQLTGVAGANARLRKLGVRAVVVPIRKGCTTSIALSYVGTKERPAPTIRLIPAEIPKGSTVVLAAKKLGVIKVEMGVGRVTGTPPRCVAPPARRTSVL